ncbi:MAG TPA: NAD-binding protein [Nitrospiraceae bacterium]|nr:NAD-binding protein [Nitrospiraceae bacterium]
MSEAVRLADCPIAVIEENSAVVENLQREGIHAILGRAEALGVLESANIAEARLLICAIPHVFEAGQVIERTRVLNPSLRILARAHSDAEVEHLTRHGADLVIMGEREIARRMAESAAL